MKQQESVKLTDCIKKALSFRKIPLGIRIIIVLAGVYEKLRQVHVKRGDAPSAELCKKARDDCAHDVMRWKRQVVS